MENCPAPDTGEITQLLARVAAGDRMADNRLAELVNQELRAVARNFMRNERIGHTLQPTALVNEAYVRLLGGATPLFVNRMHFFAIAAQTMRRILVDRARARMAAKRAHGAQVPLSFAHGISAYPEELFPPLDEALKKLALLSKRQASIVELRFFGGMKEEEIAEYLQISSRTVKRDWTAARAFLQGELGG